MVSVKGLPTFDVSKWSLLAYDPQGSQVLDTQNFMAGSDVSSTLSFKDDVTIGRSCGGICWHLRDSPK